MTPFDRRPTEEAPLEKGEPDTSAKHGTLPPPEWTPGSSPSRTTVAPRPLVRRVGLRAEQAWMRARVEEAQVADDSPALRAACMALARWLASRDRDLDEAVQLAASALSLGDDIELRRETAAWLES